MERVAALHKQAAARGEGGGESGGAGDAKRGGGSPHQA